MISYLSSLNDFIAYNTTSSSDILSTHDRYMAPEVALGRQYNNSVDTYSFAVIIWQGDQLPPSPYTTYFTLASYTLFEQHTFHLLVIAQKY